MMSYPEESYLASTDEQFRVITHPFTKCRDPKLNDGSAKFTRGYQVRKTLTIEVPQTDVIPGLDIMMQPSLQAPIAFRQSGTTWTTAQEYEGAVTNFLPDTSFNNALQYVVTPIPTGDSANPTSFQLKQTSNVSQVYRKWRLVSMGLRIRVLSDKDAKGDGVAGAKFVARGNNVTKYSILNTFFPTKWFSGVGNQIPRDLGFLVHDFDPFPVDGQGLFKDTSDVRYFTHSELSDYEFFLRPSSDVQIHGNDWVELPTVISCVGYRDPTGYGIPLVNSWYGNAEKYLFDPSFDSCLIRLNTDSFTRTKPLRVMLDVVSNYEFRLAEPSLSNIERNYAPMIGTNTNCSSVNASSYVTELYRRLMYMFPGRKLYR